jgi:hypothetical protein
MSSYFCFANSCSIESQCGSACSFSLHPIYEPTTSDLCEESELASLGVLQDNEDRGRDLTIRALGELAHASKILSFNSVRRYVGFLKLPSVFVALLMCLISFQERSSWTTAASMKSVIGFQNSLKLKQISVQVGRHVKVYATMLRYADW